MSKQNRGKPLATGQGKVQWAGSATNTPARGNS
jgi:hypothetical protein